MFFYTVEISWKRDHEIRLYRFKNCTSETVRKMRKEVIYAGIKVSKKSLDAWEIILPWFIVSFDIYQQDKFFQYDHSTVDQTVFDKDQKVI